MCEVSDRTMVFSESPPGTQEENIMTKGEKTGKE